MIENAFYAMIVKLTSVQNNQVSEICDEKFTGNSKRETFSFQQIPFTYGNWRVKLRAYKEK